MNDDDRLKKMFMALKREDKHGAPDVETLLECAGKTVRTPGHRFPFMRMAAMLALVALGFAWFHHNSRRNNGLQGLDTAGLAHWQSPTNTLLTFPGYRLSDSLQGNEQLGKTLEAPLSGPAPPPTYFLDMPYHLSSDAAL